MTSLFRSSRLLLLASLVALPTGCPEEEKSDHGYVKVMFRRADSEQESPFTGTKSVTIQLDYSACLDDFYDNNPEYEADGLEGAGIFAQFEDDGNSKGLCKQKDKNRPTAKCEMGPEGITQDRSGDVGRLRVNYTITDTDMEDKVLFFGPLPCEELTVCEPLVSATGSSGNGFGTGGAKLWGTTSFPQRDGACGQGLPIELKIAR